MRYVIVILAVALCSCASAPKLPNSQTASEQYSTLGYREKFIARNFYDLGSGDAIKRLYWSQRNLEQYRGPGGTSEASPVEKLQRRYINLPSPPFQDADGTWHEGSLHAVEVVQIWKVIPTINGGRLSLCR
jgi:hypothetical protein